MGMWTDVVDLSNFYASGLGRVARRMIVRRIRLLWPDLRGVSVLGFGYATPFLGVFRGEADRVIAAMPSAQGVVHWPADAPGLTVLVEEAALPLADRSVERILVVHAVECAEQSRRMMRELWRVLADGGRMIVVAPNRRGLWARFERTPFGHGRPFSRSQLSRQLKEGMFTPFQSTSALFVPPVRSRMLLSAAPAWENIGLRWFPSFAGVVVFEATKQIYGAAMVEEPFVAERGYVAASAR
ncbi:MAG: methyltransferase domain-containing protein [Rhodospirillales bacterium]